MTLYLLDVPTPAVRAKIRQEFERNRFVKQLPVVDVLVTKSDIEFQETMNYWKQTAQLMKYFRAEENPHVVPPRDFMTAFLEVSRPARARARSADATRSRDATRGPQRPGGGRGGMGRRFARSLCTCIFGPRPP